MLNFLVDVVAFPVKLLKKVPVKARFYVVVALAFVAAGCFITANQGYSRTLFSVLGWIFVLSIIDVFIYANNEEKAIESEAKAGKQA